MEDGRSQGGDRAEAKADGGEGSGGGKEETPPEEHNWAATSRAFNSR